MVNANLDAAANVLAQAFNKVRGDRAKTHGDMSKQFEMTAKLWSVYLENKHGIKQPVDGYDVAMMMDLLKTARATHGNASFADHYEDKAGYAAIAYSLAAIEHVSSGDDGDTPYNYTNVGRSVSTEDTMNPEFDAVRGVED